jgi:hypothetical protein
MILRAVAVWFVMLVIAVLSGAARQSLLVPRVGSHAAHVIATLLVCAIIAALIAATVRWIEPSLETRRLVLLGTFWTAATIAFEFSFGRLAGGLTWSQMLADYDVTAGRIWPLVPVTLLLAPVLAGAWHRRRNHGNG